MASASCDVAVVGGGPAGAATALAAARAGLDVALLEGSSYDSPRPGETLAPAARSVLARLGLGTAVDAASTPALGMESAWGAAELTARPSIFDPYGDGRHVDRPRFDELLAGAAAGAGARVLRGARVVACARECDGWRLTLANGAPPGRAGAPAAVGGGSEIDGGPLRRLGARAAVGGGREGDGGPPWGLGARAVIDATGRNAALARRLGARRRVRDHLVGIAVEYRGTPHAGGPTLVEAVRDGWWYAVPLPPDRFVAVLVTDADICRAGRYPDPARWTAALEATRQVGARVRGRA